MADASAASYALLQAGESRSLLRREPVVVPHLADCEIAATIRRWVALGNVGAEEGRVLVAAWAVFACQRYGISGLLPRIWELRDNVTPYDAAYVALAEALGCVLLTADVRLAQATGPRCEFAIARN